MTLAIASAAVKKLNTTHLTTLYGHQFVLPGILDQVGVALAGDANNRIAFGIISTQPSIGLGDGTSVADWFLIRNGAASAQITGTLSMTSPVIGTGVSGTAIKQDFTSNASTTLASTSAINTALALKANLASPTFTGTVTIPTGASISGFAPLASPTFTGTVTLPSGQTYPTPTITGTVTATGGVHNLTDGTATDGRVNLTVGNIGVPLASVNVYNNSADTQPMIDMQIINGVPGLALGPGGSTGNDILLSRTAATTLTLTGTLVGAVAYTGAQTQTGTTYTLVLADAGKIVTMNNAAGMTLTVPANASVAFPIGTKIPFYNKGAGTMTLAITSDTLLGTTSYLANKGGILHKLTATIWMVLASA